jgi:hypothetical protein
MYVDTVSGYLYAAGSFYMVGKMHSKGIARWNGVNWDSLEAGIDGLDTLNEYPNNTLTITTYHNKLYVGGVFYSLGKVNAPSMGAWNGTQWDSIPIQPFTHNDSYPSVNAMSVINNKLYVGGIFDTVAGFPCIGIACWNDTNWSSLNFPNLKGFFAIHGICGYKGSIYVIGNFYGNTPGDTNSNILRYDGTSWHSVGGGIKAGLAGLWTMMVYKGELYVGGQFYKADGNAGNCIQKWNGTNWSDVGGGIGTTSGGWVLDLQVYKNKLYAVGNFDSAGGIPADEIATWDSTEWCSLGSTFDNTIGTSCIYKDSLYIGGAFQTIDGDSISYISEWTGGNYTDGCGVTAVGELKINNYELNVWPNPSNGVFNFQADSQWLITNSQIEVYNMLGQQIAKSQWPTANSRMQIDISNEPSGIYMYRITSEKGEALGSGKLIIQ